MSYLPKEQVPLNDEMFILRYTCKVNGFLYRVFFPDDILLPLAYIDKRLRNFEHLDGVEFISVYVCF